MTAYWGSNTATLEILIIGTLPTFFPISCCQATGVPSAFDFCPVIIQLCRDPCQASPLKESLRAKHMVQKQSWRNLKAERRQMA
ncbi:hypothetical protein PAMP_002305 [Pampus punctatissimus]